MEGEYNLNYNTLRPVGKGAFGFVRLAQKLDDNSMVSRLHLSLFVFLLSLLLFPPPPLSRWWSSSCVRVVC